MDSEALMQLALNALSCSQKELAERLKVSPTQISKWKKGEHMSEEMEAKLRSITKIGEMSPEFVLWAGSTEDAVKWERLVHYLADIAEAGEETGYDTAPLQDDLGLLGWHTFHVLREMGVTLPPKFPVELDVDYEEIDTDKLHTLIDANQHACLIERIFRSLTDVYGFYAAYVADLLYDDKLDLMETPAEAIDSSLIALAASKIDVDEEFAPNIRKFRYDIERDYEEWLEIVKEHAFRAGVPLRAELHEMVHGSHEALGREAEAESLGFNSSRLHPDVYMNELLVGMRIIHQVLPAILEKLGIQDDFKLDTSKLRSR